MLRALRERAQPRREGKRVIFDEAQSIAAVSSLHGAGWPLVGPPATTPEERDLNEHLLASVRRHGRGRWAHEFVVARG